VTSPEIWPSSCESKEVLTIVRSLGQSIPPDELARNRLVQSE
jgi:hypothetical protein